MVNIIVNTECQHSQNDVAGLYRFGTVIKGSSPVFERMRNSTSMLLTEQNLRNCNMGHPVTINNYLNNLILFPVPFPVMAQKIFSYSLYLLQFLVL